MTDGYMKMLNKLKPEKLEAERERIKGMKQYEEEAMEEGYDFILGVDEVGRGPLCGPVVTACCVLDMKKELLFLNDSKKLSEKKRDIMSEVIKEEALCYAFGESSPELIDEINISFKQPSVKKVMSNVPIENCRCGPKEKKYKTPKEEKVNKTARCLQ